MYSVNSSNLSAVIWQGSVFIFACNIVIDHEISEVLLTQIYRRWNGSSRVSQTVAVSL